MRHGQRVDSIDHLRGILAATIMVYHYIGWSFPGWMSPDGLLSVLGYYGVAAFFVISGISLTIAYDGRLTHWSEVLQFFNRRFFRIVPLYWVAASATIFLSGANALGLTWEGLIANYTLSFSLGLGRSFVTGGWSIGNEIFFYLLFPGLFWLICRSVRCAFAVFAASAVLIALWAFVVVPSGLNDSERWWHYVSNWNQLHFFVAGLVMGRYIKPASLSRGASYGALVLAMTLLAAANVTTRGDLVEYWHRMFLSLATLLLVLSVYQINWQSSALIGRILAFLGLISYSMYLLHPVVRDAVTIVGIRIAISPMTVLIASVILTIFSSWLSYKIIETPGINLGRLLERSLSRRAVSTI